MNTKVLVCAKTLHGTLTFGQACSRPKLVRGNCITEQSLANRESAIRNCKLFGRQANSRSAGFLRVSLRLGHCGVGVQRDNRRVLACLCARYTALCSRSRCHWVAEMQLRGMLVHVPAPVADTMVTGAPVRDPLAFLVQLASRAISRAALNVVPRSTPNPMEYRAA